MKYIILMSLIFLASCTNIHFDNGTSVGEPTVGEWHHNTAIDLYEVSAPVNLNEACGSQEWSSVRTHLSFVNALARGVVNLALPVWYPKTVTVSCS